MARQWSQADLATRAGISRAAVSAIEGQRLVPSVAAALSLAAALECSVEELFSSAPQDSQLTTASRWAWGNSTESSRYWCGRVQGQTFFYPAEATPLGEIPHDGCGPPETNPARLRMADATLVMASCDPAAGLLSRFYERETGYRLLVFSRSSQQAVELLHRGVVHLAGIHLACADNRDGNLAVVRETVMEPVRLLSMADWQDGLAVGPRVAARTVRGILQDRITWIGREPGSGARRCLDELLQDRAAPRKIARDHRGVAEAIRSGWADAGVCLQIAAEEAGLRFLPIRTENYDLCYLRSSADDPRIASLVKVIRSTEFRRQLGELPGYDVRQAGTQSDSA